MSASRPPASAVTFGIDSVPETAVFYIVTLLAFDVTRKALNSSATGCHLKNRQSRKLHDETEENHGNVSKLLCPQAEILCCSARYNTDRIISQDNRKSLQTVHEISVQY